jgi:pyruvate dehydrogenase E2 component (dihydrolipoamide acetyltransferase)
MPHTVIMPKLGQTVEESTILKWHKKVGDKVSKGDVLFEIETDKAVLDVESFVEGTLLKITVNEGETVPVLVPVAFIGQPGETLPDLPSVPTVTPASPREAAISIPRSDIPIRPYTVTPAAPQSVPVLAGLPAKRKISPRARQLARESAISCEQISGTGPGGRITEKDVLRYLDAKKYNELKITPAAKALAVKEGIDLLGVEPDEPGKIAVGDIERAVAEKPKAMSKMRQVIAQRLSRSFSTAPHFYVTVAVDMTDLREFRKKLLKESKPYSVTDFILKACAIALKEFPAVNSVADGKTVKWHSRVHLGLAVEVKEGLVVPIIRNADTISLAELHENVTSLVAKARDGKLSPAEMTGSTFTISNMGMLKVENFTAIINPGESAILAVASIIPTPVVIKENLVIREIMKITLSSDHRMVDGAMAARFLNRIKDMLEDPETWKNMI